MEEILHRLSGGIKLLVIRRSGRAVAAGGIDQDIHGAKSCVYLLPRFLQRGFVQHIAGQRHRLAAILYDQFRDLQSLVKAAVHDGHFGAAGCQRP